jgi:hypothetical protein
MITIQTALKSAVLSLGASVPFLLVKILPAHSLPQWITLEGVNGSNLQYDYNSVKTLSNGTKRVDVYLPRLSQGVITYISCPNWRFTPAGGMSWQILAPGSNIETLAYKLCANKKKY